MTSPKDGGELLALAEWCRVEREKIGAIDGYDYRSGEEFGLRRAQIEIERRASALPERAPAGEPTAYRWRYAHSDHWTLRSTPVVTNDLIICEPLYLAADAPGDASREELAVACLQRLARCNIDNQTQRDLAGADIKSTLEKIERLAAKPADDGVRELKQRIHNLRVTLSSVVTLAESGGVSLKTLNAIAKAAKHSLNRDLSISGKTP